VFYLKLNLAVSEVFYHTKIFLNKRFLRKYTLKIGSKTRASTLTNICRKFAGVKSARVHLTGQCVVKTLTRTNKSEFPIEMTTSGKERMKRDRL